MRVRVSPLGAVMGMPWYTRSSRDSHRNNVDDVAALLNHKYGTDGYLVFNLWCVAAAVTASQAVCCGAVTRACVAVSPRTCSASLPERPTYYEKFNGQVGPHGVAVARSCCCSCLLLL